MQKFTASIQYDRETICRLDTVIENTFRFSRKAYLLICCFILIGVGVFMGMNTPTGIVCILLGCVCLPSVNSLQSRNARQIIQAMDGRTMRMIYTFYSGEFTCSAGGQTNTYRYDSIIRLVEDKGYLYLFQSATKACMIDINTLEPNRPKEYKRFISKRVGLEWTEPVTFRTLSISQHRFNRRNTRVICR